MPFNFSLSNILTGIFFGIIGIAAWRYGRKQASARHMLLGVALILFSYFFEKVWVLFLVGVGLTGLLFWP